MAGRFGGRTKPVVEIEGKLPKSSQRRRLRIGKEISLYLLLNQLLAFLLSPLGLPGGRDIERQDSAGRHETQRHPMLDPGSLKSRE